MLLLKFWKRGAEDIQTFILLESIFWVLFFFEIVGVSRWVDQAGLELSEVCLPSAEIKGLSHYASGLYVF